MAFPTILFDSSAGGASDTAASGAGPATALTGTAAATDGTNGKTVTITDAVDLSGVATDGTAALRIIDTTAGHRNWDQITAISGTSGNWTVTVQNGFTISLTGKTWAIGGKLVSLFSNSGNALSIRIWNNNSAAGDAMPGWTMQLQSGHSEAATATQFSPYRSGDTTNGPITLRGQSGSQPVLTYNLNGRFLNIVRGASFWVFQDFELRNSNVSKNASIGIYTSDSASGIVIRNVKCNATGANQTWHAFDMDNDGVTIIECEAGNCAAAGIFINSGATNARVINCYIHNNTGDGVTISGVASGALFAGNLIVNNGGNGISSNGSTAGINNFTFIGNTIDGNTGDGFTLQTSTNFVVAGHVILNNQMTNNTGWWLNSTGITTDVGLLATGIVIYGNNHFGNGHSNLASPTLTLTEQYGTSVNPSYNNAAGGDYTVTNASAKGIAYPPGGTLTVGKTSTTNTYPTAGAAAPNPAASGGIKRVTFGGGF